MCATVVCSGPARGVWCVSAGEAGSADPLAFLRSMPQFAQLRAAIQRNPHMLQPMLQELGQSNPQLLAVSGWRGEWLAVGVSVEEGEERVACCGCVSGGRGGEGMVCQWRKGRGFPAVGVSVEVCLVLCSSSARTRRASCSSSTRPQPTHPRGRGRGRGRSHQGRAGLTTSQ